MIHNPIAGWRRHRRLVEVLGELEEMGCPVTVFDTMARGDAERMARDASSDEFDVIAAAGGDGTIGEVVNGLAGKDIPLGVIPLGAANVFAAEIGLPDSEGDIARVLAEGPVRPVYAGRANGIRFVMMAGVGFDAHVVARVSRRLKSLLGKGAYVVASVVEMIRSTYPTYDITIDGARFEAASAVIAKGHFYGGRRVCCPDARLEDPNFHVCLFLRGGFWATAKYGAALLTGGLARRSDVLIVSGKDIRIEGPDDDEVQADGDFICRLPLEAAIDEDVLGVVFPA